MRRGVGHGGARSGGVLGRQGAHASERFGSAITAITGPATDNEVGRDYINAELGLPAHNARRDAPGAGRGGRAPSSGGAWQAGTSRAANSRRRLTMRVAVIGAAGYAGGELLRLLLPHPEVTEWVATSRSQAGQAGGRRASAARAAHRRALRGARARRGGARTRRGVPGARARRIIASLAPESSTAGAGLVIDLAADFRVARSRRSTPGTTARIRRPSCCRASPTGWPTCWVRAARRHGDRGAGLLRHGGAARALSARRHRLGLARALRRHRLERRRRQPKPTTHHPARAHNLFAYSVLGHRHEAEVLRAWRRVDGPATDATRD